MREEAHSVEVFKRMGERKCVWGRERERERECVWKSVRGWEGGRNKIQSSHHKVLEKETGRDFSIVFKYRARSSHTFFESLTLSKFWLRLTVKKIDCINYLIVKCKLFWGFQQLFICFFKSWSPLLMILKVNFSPLLYSSCYRADPTINDFQMVQLKYNFSERKN